MKTRRRRNIRKNKKNKNKKMNTKKIRKRSTRMARGLQECCMCGSKFVKKTALVPQECLMKYGKIRAHKVCPRCWWGEFAKEGASHKCPGCVKGLPLAKDVNAGTVIDLTEGTGGLTEDIVEAVEDGLEEEV